MLHSEYREKSEIRWMWTQNGKIVPEKDSWRYAENQVSDWFRGGQAIIDRAEGAATEEEADRILSEAYLEIDKNSVGLHWEICFYMPGRLS
jgi:hypothetical protein